MNLLGKEAAPLFRLSVPIVIGQLGIIVLGFADTLMVGHHSTAELAAAGFVNNVFSFILLFYLGFSYGLTPIVGRLYGQRRGDELGAKLKNAVVANGFVGLLLTAAMVLLYFNLHRIGQPEELLPLIRPYFLVNLGSLLFVGLFNTLKQLFDGTTDTRSPMWMMVGGNCVNILLNWLLIYGVAGLPELGLLGAGVATLTARVLTAMGLGVVFLLAKRCQPYRDGWRKGRLNRVDFGEMNRMGWPLAFQLGVESAAFSLCSVMVGWIGTTALAAHQVMITLSQLFYMVYYGIGAAVSIRVSNYVGQGDYGAVRRNAATGFRMVLLLALVFSIPVFLLRHEIGGWFNDSHEVKVLVSVVIIPLLTYQFGDGLQIVYGNSLRGIGCVKPLATYAFAAFFLVNIPLSYVLGLVFDFGLVGVWYAYPFGLTLAGWLYWRKFRLSTAKG
ncbi:MATE family efflux transporter [Prevotella sp.]|uniref:MATE family efflux transporter n=1 Tax=Prevotella sp. TaxID=59823 RepID=UPI002F95F6AF